MANLVIEKKELQGIPFWTQDGVETVFDMNDVFCRILEDLNLPFEHILITDFVDGDQFDKFFEHRFFSALIPATEKLIFAPETNFIIFPYLVSNELNDRFCISINQRYRSQESKKDVWKDSNIWPNFTINYIDTTGKIDLNSLRSIFERFFSMIALQPIVIDYNKEPYGKGFLFCGQVSPQELTGLALVYELGHLFREKWNSNLRYFDTGFTGKLIYYLNSDYQEFKELEIKRDFDFETNALLPLCPDCAKKLGYINIGKALELPLEECIYCRQKSSVRLISKKNNFY